MAKKTKRKVSAVISPAPAPEVFRVSEVSTPVSTGAVTARAGAGRSVSRRTTSTVEFNPDYSYVVKDLKRIGILAGSFFAILIALSFFIK